MNDKELRSFLEVCRYRSITRAAKELYISPQGLSRLIKNLERELGVMLFVRTPGGVELTEGGKMLHEHAVHVVQHFDRIKKEAELIQRREHGSVQLLSAYGILRLLGPECIFKFKETYRDIEFSYKEYPDRQVEQRYEGGEGDIAFSIGPFDEDKYEIIPLKTFPIRLLVNQDHPLSQRDSVGIADIKGQPLYIESGDFKINTLIKERCREAGFAPDIMFETSGFSLCHKMCRQNKGITVTVEFISKDMSVEGCRLLPFHDGIYEWNACMLLRKGEMTSEAVRIFRDYILRWNGMMTVSE